MPWRSPPPPYGLYLTVAAGMGHLAYLYKKKRVHMDELQKSAQVGSSDQNDTEGRRRGSVADEIIGSPAVDSTNNQGTFCPAANDTINPATPALKLDDKERDTTSASGRIDDRHAVDGKHNPATPDLILDDKERDTTSASGRIDDRPAVDGKHNPETPVLILEDTPSSGPAGDGMNDGNTRTPSLILDLNGDTTPKIGGNESGITKDTTENATKTASEEGARTTRIDEGANAAHNPSTPSISFL